MVVRLFRRRVAGACFTRHLAVNLASSALLQVLQVRALPKATSDVLSTRHGTLQPGGCPQVQIICCMILSTDPLILLRPHHAIILI
jgi:hypothetical protein